MKNRLTLALVPSLMTALACAFAPSQGPLLPRAFAQTPTHAPAASGTRKGGSAQPSSPSSKAQPSSKKTTEASKLPIVREVDLPGLKKLLQREGAQTRPLLVNFWATWCEPCREEFPDLVKIDEQYGEARLDFITVSLDDMSDIETGVPQYLEQMHARMPAYLLNVPDPEAVINLVDPQWTGAMPATFLFDSRGTLVFKHMGRIKPDELRTAIEKQVGGKQ